MKLHLILLLVATFTLSTTALDSSAKDSALLSNTQKHLRAVHHGPGEDEVGEAPKEAPKGLEWQQAPQQAPHQQAQKHQAQGQAQELAQKHQAQEQAQEQAQKHQAQKHQALGQCKLANGCPLDKPFKYPGTTRCFATKWKAPRCDFGHTVDGDHPACTFPFHLCTFPRPLTKMEAADEKASKDKKHHGDGDH